jgi:hypothetical protein
MGRPADREDGFGDGRGRVIPRGRNPETGFGNAKIIHTGFCNLLHQRGGENSFLTRVGGSYEFEFSGLSLSPEVNVDFVDQSSVNPVIVEYSWSCRYESIKTPR